MPYFPPSYVSLDPGEASIIQPLNIVQATETSLSPYSYSYRLHDPQTSLPTGLMLDADGYYLSGTAPSTPGTYTLEIEAVQVDGGPTNDPNAAAHDSDVGSAKPEYVGLLFIQIRRLRSNLLTASLQTRLNGLSWRDLDTARVGVRHSDPRSRFLFMDMPAWAQPGYAPSTVSGGVTSQYLPIENIQEMILPRITSNRVDVELDKPSQGYYLGADLRPRGADGAQPGLFSRGRAAFRTFVRYEGAALRILWNEDYDTHGGPYGLRDMALNLQDSRHFVYFMRDFRNPDDGRIIYSFPGHVSEFTETATRNGIVVDAVIQPEAGFLLRPEPRPVRYGGQGVGAIVWPEASPGM